MLIVHAAFKWCTEILMKKTVICMNHISFQIGLVLGIGGIVNLFIMFIEQKFSLMWLLFSLVLIIGSNRWLLSKTTLRSEELKEIYWAKHGVWTVGIVVLFIGSFKHEFTTNFLISTVLLIALIIIQFVIYRYQLKKYT